MNSLLCLQDASSDAGSNDTEMMKNYRFRNVSILLSQVVEAKLKHHQAQGFRKALRTMNFEAIVNKIP